MNIFDRSIETIEIFLEKYLPKFLVATVVAIPTLIVLVVLISLISQSQHAELIGVLSTLVLMMITFTISTGLMNLVSMRSRNRQTGKFIIKIVLVGIFIGINLVFVFNENIAMIATSGQNIGNGVIFLDSYILAYIFVDWFQIVSKKMLSGSTEDVANRIKFVNQFIIGFITIVSSIFAAILLYLEILEKL